jgi:hypothetical protein
MESTRKSPSRESSTEVEQTTGNPPRRKGRKHTEVNQDPRPKRRNPASPDLPPNENLDKHPDEAYGDTKIPERNEDL